MVRLNLQLFAYTGNSIVDYLKSEGKDSSFSARKSLAESNGISNYTGSASQNTQLLNKLRSGSSSSTTSKTTSTNNSTTTTTSTKSNLNGVDQTTLDTMNSKFNQSNSATEKQQAAETAYNKFNEIASVEDIIDQTTWDTLNSSFVASDAYNQAMEYTNGLLQQLSSGRTSYTDQIKDLMGQIQNREDFEYNVEEDQLFQQALASAMNSGKSAMQDTIGQASALTGGYGSTYATSAGNQAYNAFIEDAYNNLPEYYKMAMEAYQMEGQEMYNQLAMLNDADASEYQRMYDSWNANFANTQQMWNQEYGVWQDSITNAYNSANLQLSEHGQLVENAYNLYNAAQNSYESMYAKEYQSWSDMVSQAQTYASMLNTDYWNQTNFDESVRQYEKNYEQTEKWNQKNLDYNYAQLQLDRDKFNYSKTSSNTGGTTSDGSKVDEIPKAISTKAGKFKNNGELEEYLDNQVNQGTITEGQADYLYSVNASLEQVPLNKRTWTMTDDGGNNGFGGIDNNGKAKDQYGNVYRMDDLYDELKKTMSNKDAKKYVTDLQKKIGITKK